MTYAIIDVTPSQVSIREEEVSISTRKLIGAGFVVTALFFGGLGLWSWYAPLSIGAHAPGVLKVESERQVVQHLEGGIVREILVREGSQVVAGQPLLRLDATRYSATLSIHRDNHLNLTASLARLEAEQAGAKSVTYPQDLLRQADDPKVAAVIAAQNLLFESRRLAVENQIVELGERIVQGRAEVRALEATIQAQARQIAGYREELAAVAALLQNGIERKPRLLALQRSIALTEAQQSASAAEIAKARQKIAEAEQMIAQIRGGHLNSIATELKTVRAQLFEVNDRIIVVEDALSRLVITAPRDGTVLGLRYHSPGSVIPANGQVLEIVPSNDTLIVEGRLDTQQIEHVVAGLPAQVRLLAYSMRRLPPIEGRVTTVSADAVKEDMFGSTSGLFYRVKVALDPRSLAQAGDIRLQAGMPTEILINAGEQTLAEYILEPIVAGVRRAFRER
jgi:HlyD family type I secretion membrane fusion protein